jgi:DNA polymerase elongation subunit (family B)
LKNIIEGFIMEERRPLFYYTEKKDRVFKVFFQLEALMSLCYEYLEKNGIMFENGSVLPAKAYHNGDSDRIPTVEKLMVEKKLQRCSWMFAQGRQVFNDAITTLAKEYIISYDTMNMLPEEYALKLGYPKPSTVSFDAECFSAIFTRFPKASRLTDCMYAIGFRHRVYSSLQDKKGTVVNYLLIIWDKDQYGELKDYSHIYGKTVYIYCKTEEEFLASIFQLLIELDPTFIVSFNGLGFDWDYIEQRCEILGVKVPNLSRIKSWSKSQFKKKDWKIFRSTWPNYMGRMDVDMLYLIRLQFKMNSYKLKDVAKELLPNEPGKVDLKYKDQFKYFADKDKHGMDLIAEYLLGDILLPEKLYDRLSMPVYLHTNGSVMRVNPLSLYVEGQSIRCICQLYSDVVENGMYINSRTIWKAGKYIGGLVFDQIPGIYANVLTFDFNSLYPSKMKAMNICYTTLIQEEVDGAQYRDEDCHVVQGDVPFVDKKTKEVIEVKNYKFRYIHKHKFVGLLPRIVTRLNALRNKYKAEMDKCYGKAKKIKAELDALKTKPKEEQNAEEIQKLQEEYNYWQGEGDIWNVKQNAVKVSANSMYGFMGMKTGKFSFIEGGMSTTIAGREAISEALQIIIKDFGAKLIYGDSVTGKTPILIRINNRTVSITTIEDLFNTYPDQKKIEGLDDKEYKIINNVEAWTEKGWTKIQNVMRHKTTKKIYGVLTNTGYVEVTEDHSLLNSNTEEVTPKDLKPGDQLLQSYPIENHEKKKGNGAFLFNSQLDAAYQYQELQKLGYKVQLEKAGDSFSLRTFGFVREEENVIQIVEEISREEDEIYVYDLTTENHHFQAGIGNIIVHNTDSLMVTFPEGFVTKENYGDRAKMISKHISSKFHEKGQEEINMAWENYFLWFFTITKKRYAGLKIDRDNPNKIPTKQEIKDKKLLYIRGLISVRGNSCGIVYKNFNEILIDMLLQTPVQQLFDYLHEMCLKIMRRDYPFIDYTFVQKLGQNYKGKSATMNVFNEGLKRQGRIHKPGEDLEYVIVKTYGDCLKGERMQAPDLFIDNENVLDTMSYVVSQIAKPVEQLLTCVYDDSVLKNHEKKIIRPRKPTSVQKVTNVWHLELYIRKYIAHIHSIWENVQNHIKCLRCLAESRGFINYVIDETVVIRKMKERYGIDWKPETKNPNGLVKEWKEKGERKPFKSDYNLE